MRVAAIDVGTNSVHLLVAEVDAQGGIRTIEKARAQVMLGSGGIGDQRIAPDAFERGLEAMRSFAAAAASLEVDDIQAAATSAVREAANGAEFRHAVKEQTGIHVRVISGHEEGRLIYLGARSDLDLTRGPVALCDLGGGSTELIVCDADGPQHIRSLPLGHIRLTDRYHQGEQLTDEMRREMKRAIRAELEVVQRRVPKGSVGSLVGTSGAIRCLARMATLRRGETIPEHDQGLVLYRKDVESLITTFSQLSKDEVALLPGMDERRRDTLPSGAVLVREVMKALGVDALTTSERSLRDGLVVDWIERHRPEIDLSSTFDSPRERSVRLAMQRFGVSTAHAEYVARLALQLYDATADLHHLPIGDRELLRAAALMHDIGHHISDRSHHKHGQYLLKHIRMYGYTAPELAIIHNTVRYHSRSMPSGAHRDWIALSKDDRSRVRVLAGLLKIADALDRSQQQPVQDLTVRILPREVHIDAVCSDGGHVERWATARRTGLLSKALGRRVVVHVSGADEP